MFVMESTQGNFHCNSTFLFPFLLAAEHFYEENSLADSVFLCGIKMKLTPPLGEKKKIKVAGAYFLSLYWNLGRFPQK